MDIFDKAVQKAKEVGNSVVTTATSVGNSISNVTKEQTDLANLRLKRNSMEKKLQSLYVSIGKAYVEMKAQDEEGKTDELAVLYQEYVDTLAELKEVKEQIIVFENRSTQNSIEKNRKKAEAKFEADKEKLERALALEVITVEEYQEKLSDARKKLDCFDEISRIELQLEMDIIDKAEYDEKIARILEK